MKRVLIALVVLLLVLSPFAFCQEAEEPEKVEETEKVEEASNPGEFVVKKLEHGVEVVLEPDRVIQRPWSKSFTFNIDYDYEEETSYATTGFWLGNGITSYWLTYSRNVHEEDPGQVSFSFSWAF